MTTFYVREDGAVVRKSDERLVVTKDDKTIGQIPLREVDQLVLMGNVQVTAQTMSMLLKARVDVVHMTRAGRLLGNTTANGSRFAELRLRQLQMVNDPRASLEIARQVVMGKLSNQLHLLESIKARGDADWVSGAGDADEARLASRASRILSQRAYSAAVQGIREMILKAAQAQNAESLLGFEGRAGAWYWPAFRLMLSNDMGFTKRIYFPSPDPINALLSFGYALLQKDMMAAVQLKQLDPYLGCFHVVQYGRPSLALDLMEEFRPVVIDRLVLRLVNLGMIKERDFERQGSRRDAKAEDEDEPPARSPAMPIKLREEALRRVIEAYEQRVTATVRYPITGEVTPLRRCFELQAGQIRRVVMGEQARYQPMVPPASAYPRAAFPLLPMPSEADARDERAL